MPYRGPQSARMAQQMAQDVIEHAGQVMTWRAFISASGGVALAGFGATAYYRETTITGILGRAPVQFNIPDAQTPAGTLAQGRFLATTHERLGRQDELVWQGSTYRVESEAIPSRFSDMWTVEVKRGDL